MSGGVRRGVTRAYVLGLIGATLIVAVALIVASWGMLGLAIGREPVETPGVPIWLGAVSIGLSLVLLAVLLWRHAIALLKGRQQPIPGLILGAGFGAYILWCLIGLLGGLSIDETWLSPYAWVLAVIWALAVVLFWLVLVRRVYTNRPVPKWPWERREEQD